MSFDAYFFGFFIGFVVGHWLGARNQTDWFNRHPDEYFRQRAKKGLK